MRITLKKSELKNFKKLTGFYEFDPGKSVFCGENGTGKTTLYDASQWLLFGKDSLGSAKFDIKTIIDGEAVSQVNHSVCNTYDIDGQELTLERVYSEIWKKTRGSIEKTFDGHKTDYRIDGNAKTTKRDFDQKVLEIFGSDNFKISTDPRYFATLTWERRREILSTMAGKIDHDQIIDSIPGFRALLKDRSTSEAKKLADERRRKINEELKTIPAQIAEHRDYISSVSGSELMIESAEKKVAESREAVVYVQKKIENFKQGESSGDIEKLKKLNAELFRKTSELESAEYKASSDYQKTVNRISEIVRLIPELQTTIDNNKIEIAELVKKWHEADESIFTTDGNTCKFCGEGIICGNCDETDQKGEENFNIQKSQKIETIDKTGAVLVEKNKKFEEMIVDLLAEKLELLKIQEPELIATTPEIEELKKQIAELGEVKTEIEIPAEFLTQLEDAEKAVDIALENLSGIKATIQSNSRVRELENKMENIRAEFDKIEQFIYLFEEYNKKLAEQTEASVNQLFEYVSFRMFNTQINGAIVPCCDITDKSGRSYETALSYGERLRAGLDIIKTMSRHFDIFAPVFVDNAESLTIPVYLESQLIFLLASDGHKELTRVA